MKNIKNKLIIILALFLTAFFISCGDDPEPDLCATESPVTADFKIFEAFQGSENRLPDTWEYHDTDTVNTFVVIFTALEEDAEYEWKIGAETITTKSFSRHSFPLGENIEVSLKVSKNPNIECFPDDDGMDENSRVFYTMEDFFCDTVVSGEYTGYNLGEEDKIRDITIDVCYVSPEDPMSRSFLRTINLVEGCDMFGFELKFPRYKYLDFGANGKVDCFDPTGKAKVFGVNNDSILIEYTVKRGQDIFDDRINKTFIGVRKK